MSRSKHGPHVAYDWERNLYVHADGATWPAEHKARGIRSRKHARAARKKDRLALRRAYRAGEKKLITEIQRQVRASMAELFLPAPPNGYYDDRVQVTVNTVTGKATVTRVPRNVPPLPVRLTKDAP